MADGALWAAALVATAAAGGALVLRDPRLRVAAMAVALVLAPVLIAADNWNDERIRDLRDSPAVLVLAGVAGTMLLVGLAAIFRRLPAAMPLLAFAALPFRIPVETGGGDARLLVPLYVVIAAGVLAELRPLVAGRRSSERRAGPGSEDQRPVNNDSVLRWLPWALAGWIFLYAIQGLYSDGFSSAVENIAFFLVPFAVLAGLLLRVEWTPRLLVQLLAVVVAEAAIFALVAFAQYATRELFWNDAIIAANEVHTYFRVNSLFWDPNIFGRYMALTLIAVVAVMLWTRSARRTWVAGGVAVVFLAALAITYSQSSLIAFLAGLAVLAALRWSVRWTATACVVAAAIGLAGVAISDESLSVETSGRDELIEGGLELAEERPLTGHGSGSFQKEFERRSRFGDDKAEAVSHTEPVTVSAEQGALGLIAYLAVIVLAIAALARGIHAWAPGVAGGGGSLGGPDGPVVGVARAALLAALMAMVVHSLSYAAFFTDPITWALVAVGLTLARQT
jgi:putative inorganic carbon (hco3(-)) transporter